MKGFSQDKFFAELNLENLSKIKKREIWEKFLELASIKVLDEILDTLPKRQQETLFLSLAQNPKKVEKFLKDYSKFSKIAKQALSFAKKEVAKTFKKKK